MYKFLYRRIKIFRPLTGASTGSSSIKRADQQPKLKINGPGTFLIILFSVIAFQGFLELESNASSFLGSISIWAGNKFLRFGLYLCLGLLLLWLLRYKQHYTIKFRNSMKIILFLYFEMILVIIMGLIQINSRNIETTIFSELRQMVEVIILIPIIYLSIQQIHEIRKALNWFTNLLTIIALMNIFGYLSRFYLNWTIPVFSSLFPFIILFGAVYSFAKYLTSRKNYWNLIQCITLFAGANITFHKPVVICGIFGYLITWLILYLNADRISRVNRRLLVTKLFLIILILTILFLLSNLIASNNLLLNYKYLFDTKYLKISTGGQVDGNRFLIWDETWNNFFLKNPWLGSGWGVRIDLSYDGDAYVHNMFLYWLACTGIVGSVILFSLIFSIIVYIKRRIDWNRDFDIKAGLVGFFAILFAQNFIGVMFAEVSLTYTLGIAIALILRLATQDALKGNNNMRNQRNILGGSQ